MPLRWERGRSASTVAEPYSSRVARSVSNAAFLSGGGRRTHDHAQSAFGELAPYRILAALLALTGVLAFVFAFTTDTGSVLQTVDFIAGGLMIAAGACLLVLGPRASSGWPLDLALLFGYTVAAAGMLFVPDAIGQLVIGFALVLFGVFAGVFRPAERLIWHVALMLGMYAGVLLLDPHLAFVYFLVVAVAVVVVSGMVFVMSARLRDMALHDPLTGVLNRRGLEVMADVVAAQSARTDTPVAVAVIDLDRFKQFNDSQGHAAGDALLVEIADAWESEARGSDLVARLGGDEFAAVLPGAEVHEVEDLVRRVRTRTSAAFSVGVAQWIPAEDLYTALTRADEKMFHDKQLSRLGDVDPFERDDLTLDELGDPGPGDADDAR